VIADWTKSDPKTAPYDLEKTGYGFKTTQRIPASEAELPSTCQMKRPG
jgi:branched-chain amino acid transport system substrate-binding protein